MTFDWLIFDADDTLFQFDASAGLALLCAQHQLPFNPAIYDEYQARNQPLWQRYQAGEISATQLQTERFAPWAAQANTSASALNRDFLQAMAKVSRFMPHAEAMLRQAAQHYRLAILTNGFTELQQQRLDALGVADLFEHVIISEQVGFAKPHPQVFTHTLQQLNTTAPRALMLGDTHATDIVGGHNAGLATCWYNPKQQPLALEAATPTLHIQCWQQLLPSLSQLSATTD